MSQLSFRKLYSEISGRFEIYIYIYIYMVNYSKSTYGLVDFNIINLWFKKSLYPLGV